MTSAYARVARTLAGNSSPIGARSPTVARMNTAANATIPAI